MKLSSNVGMCCGGECDCEIWRNVKLLTLANPFPELKIRPESYKVWKAQTKSQVHEKSADIDY